MYKEILHIGQFTLHSYGVLLVIGFFAAILLARKRAPLFGLKPETLADASFWALIFGILGARVTYIAQEWPTYAGKPNEIFSLQLAGLTSFGGLIFGGIALGVWAWRKNVSILAMFDACGGPFLIAHAIGRVGCLLNGCCFGRACTDQWCVRMGESPTTYLPAQIFDSLMNVAAFGILVLLERRRPRLGQSFGLMLILHGITRFIYEFWRAGTVAEVKAGVASSTQISGTWITEGQVAALAIAAIGAALWWAARNRPRVGSEPE